MDELLDWRKEFPILDNTVYMISHSLGAMPRRTRDRLQEYADMWATRGIRSWEEGWWMMPTTVGDLIGKIIGAGDGEVVMHQNVSICQSIINSCFNFSEGKRNKIVSESLNFPSNLYIYNALVQDGARLVTVPSDDGITVPLERMLSAIDEETLLVSVSHVIFRSSFIQDIKAITERAHEVGAMVVADIYQSAGTVPINVREVGLDFATGGSVKWLCGGPGAGYLYVRRDLWPQLEPRLTGWLAHKHPFAFETGPNDYADNIYRFLNGSPNVPGMYAAMSGYEIINEVGVEHIREKSIRQTTRLIEIAEDAGFKVNCPKNVSERGGTVVIDVPHGQQVTAELLRRDFLVDYRPGAGIRVAPHFYSKDEELELTVREIKQILETKGLTTVVSGSIVRGSRKSIESESRRGHGGPAA
ncbi:MAG TPA: aminotransferase class V-fold PLP-dependent enzyme, partial [Blastocatellia bacterium]|nr:aminotransferase class V-fold PLP-dependent enzyme [Blastocatellia bacterium]